MQVPRSLLRAHRTEVTALPLTLVAGTLPSDLAGHAFFVAPAGTVETNGLPDPDGNTVMCSDGMVIRLDLAPTGIAATTRLVETPDLVADRATVSRPLLDPLRFRSSGIARVSLLGARNFANTAFCPMPRAGAATRMLVTYDAGRPVEIDPSTLAFVTPVGSRADWRSNTFEDAPFPLVLCPAHPAYDPNAGELFAGCYGRSPASMFGVGAVTRAVDAVGLDMVGEKVAAIFGAGAAARSLFRVVGARVEGVFDRVNDLLGRVPLVPEDFLDLVRWDGGASFRRYRLVHRDDPDHRIHVRQSIHQVAVTKRHVIFLETAFRVGLDHGFNDVIPETDAGDRLLRQVTSGRQPDDTLFYIVRRSDLDDPALPRDGDGTPIVRATVARVPLEADHFLADFDDAGDRITLHVAHAPATDLSEWVRGYDETATRGHRIDPALRGMMAVGAMDLNRFGRYVVDANTGVVVDGKVLSKDPLTWAIALYAGRDIGTDAAPPDAIEQLYWVCEGVFDELLTQFTYERYADYAHRLVSESRILDIAMNGGRHAAIVRVDTTRLEIADHFTLPAGMMVGSMQFVARPGTTGPTEGYLVCSVCTPLRTEIWILDADDLTAGPRARLHHPSLVFGFSLHTAWLPTVLARTANYRVTAAADFPNALRADWSGDVRALVEGTIIPTCY